MNIIDRSVSKSLDKIHKKKCVQIINSDDLHLLIRRYNHYQNLVVDLLNEAEFHASYYKSKP